MALALSGQIQVNRGGHPYVEIATEADDGTYSELYRALRALPSRRRGNGGVIFTEPITATIEGVEYTLNGMGATFHEDVTIRERNPRNGKIKETTRRVVGSGACYVYLQEPPRVAAPAGRIADDLDEDERAVWGDFHSAARESRREDYWGRTGQ